MIAKLSRSALVIVIGVTLFCYRGAGGAPQFVYLTWQGKTGTTATVNYHTDAKVGESTVRYDVQSRGGRIDTYDSEARGRRHQIEGLADGRTIHVVELTGLEPGTTYFFVAGDRTHGYSEERSFRTIPVDGRPVRFVVGGDMGTGRDVATLMTHAAATDPMFAVIGGDIAYANGNLAKAGNWDRWLDLWQRHMRTPDGRDVPIVAVIGNHEARGQYGQPIEKAPFFTGYLAQSDDRTYFSRRFGPNLMLIVLDSGHVAAHDGAQAAWLEAQLQQFKNVPNRVAAYHVPLYPTTRRYTGEYSTRGREHWAPLFDRYELTAAFEHHDHAFKRTWPIRNGQRDPAGTVYFGDGCFGMPPEPLAPKQWYEAKGAGLQHFWSVEATAEQLHCRAISKDGDVFDVYPPNGPGADEAQRIWPLLAWPRLIGEVIPEQTFNRPVDTTVAWAMSNPLTTALRVAVELAPVAGVRFAPPRKQLVLAPGAGMVLNIAVTSDAARNRLTVGSRWRIDAGNGPRESVHTSVLSFRREVVVNTFENIAPPPLAGSLPAAVARTMPNIAGFVQRRDGQPAVQSTDAWITAMPAGLFVHMICHDRDMANRLSPSSPQNSFTYHTRALEAGNPFWEDDNIELFVIPRAEPVGVMQYVVTLGGATYVDRWPDAGEHLHGSGFRSNISRSDDHWIAELLIPWSDFDRQGPPPAGTVWRLDIARTHTLNKSDISRWASPAISNHAAEHFGYIRFE